jgi:hypothetical protein
VSHRGSIVFAEVPDLSPRRLNLLTDASGLSGAMLMTPAHSGRATEIADGIEK